MSRIRTFVLGYTVNWAPLTAIAAVGRNAIVQTPPSSVSSPSWSELPKRRDVYPLGGLVAAPALSLRAKGAKDLAPPPCTEETRGEG